MKDKTLLTILALVAFTIVAISIFFGSWVILEGVH